MELHESREEFMRRWFAIAISLGFASTVISTGWVQDGRWPPNENEWSHIFRLSAALLATLFSWEGYFISIQTKPLKDIWRYLIDVLLVFLYLFILITSKFPNYWLHLHAACFFIYAIWDLITISKYRTAFYEESILLTQPTVAQVYWGGLLAKSGIRRGPIITLGWLIYFTAIASIVPEIGREIERNEMWLTLIAAILVIWGVVIYRFNKSERRNAKAWPWLPLIGSLILLLGLDLCGYFGLSESTILGWKNR